MPATVANFILVHLFLDLFVLALFSVAKICVCKRNFSLLLIFFLFALTLTPCVSELYLRLLGEQTHHNSTQNTIDSHSLIRLRSFLLNETLSFTRLLPSPESYNSKTCKTKYRESVRCKRNEKEIAQKSYTFGR